MSVETLPYLHCVFFVIQIFLYGCFVFPILVGQLFNVAEYCLYLK